MQPTTKNIFKAHPITRYIPDPIKYTAIINFLGLVPDTVLTHINNMRQVEMYYYISAQNKFAESFDKPLDFETHKFTKTITGCAKIWQTYTMMSTKTPNPDSNLTFKTEKHFLKAIFEYYLTIKACVAHQLKTLMDMKAHLPLKDLPTTYEDLQKEKMLPIVYQHFFVQEIQYSDMFKHALCVRCGHVKDTEMKISDEELQYYKNNLYNQTDKCNHNLSWPPQKVSKIHVKALDLRKNTAVIAVEIAGSVTAAHVGAFTCLATAGFGMYVLPSVAAIAATPPVAFCLMAVGLPIAAAVSVLSGGVTLYSTKTAIDGVAQLGSYAAEALQIKDAQKSVMESVEKYKICHSLKDRFNTIMLEILISCNLKAIQGEEFYNIFLNEDFAENIKVYELHKGKQQFNECVKNVKVSVLTKT